MIEVYTSSDVCICSGYLISGDSRLWDMFSTQYEATKRFLKKSRYMITVHSGAPKNRVREHQDALQAFWPGLQVLAGKFYSEAVWPGLQTYLPVSFTYRLSGLVYKLTCR
jgi:hypothetical protein